MTICARCGVKVLPEMQRKQDPIASIWQIADFFS
jgi:hypothetical protein